MIERLKNILLISYRYSQIGLPRFKSNSSSSKRWLERQKKDPYVKLASKELYRARSAFKLIEIDYKYTFIEPGHVVVDVGSSPGSWTQVAIKKTNSDNKGLLPSIFGDSF